jgi:hypothetical protein
MRLLLLSTVLIACGKEPTRTAEVPEELVRVESIEPPEGTDTAPMTDGAWIRYQEISIHPCSFAIRVRVDSSGAVSSVVDRAYDCTGVIAPAYQPKRQLSPAEVGELRAALETSGFWRLGPAYRRGDRMNGGKHVRIEIREDGRAHTVDYRQVEDVRLERVVAILLEGT